jgi:UDP-N-acetyl-D-glucosamine dehydrogenase
MNIVIVGLGYVGLPLACLCAKKGHRTVGLDINEEIVDRVNRGLSHIKDARLEESVASVKGILKADVNPEVVADADIVVVCVPTPVDHLHHPDLTPVRKACEAIAPNMKKGQLIVIESTIYPGTVEEFCVPILETSGLKAGVDFSISHCPERIDPGNPKWHVGNIPRVCGGIDKKSTDRTAEFYRSVIDAEITPLSSVKAAEAVKIMENTFRDVNIAFVNEMARSFAKAGIDITEVIRGATTKPFAFMPHYPGCGVGGHCIAVDPYYLIEKAKSYGFDHQFLSLARKINNGMPEYTVELATEALNASGKSVKGSRIGILGITYKGNVDDTRESPAYDIIKLLKERGAQLIIFDPWVPAESTATSLNECISRSEILVLCANHKQFLTMDFAQAAKAGIKAIVDGRNFLDKKAVQDAGIIYKGIGR